MTKADLSKYIQEHLGGLTHKQAAELVEDIIGIIKQTLADGDNVKISGFGSFVVKDKHARNGRNPKTGVPLTIQARRVVTFKASQILALFVVSAGSRSPPVVQKSFPLENIDNCHLERFGTRIKRTVSGRNDEQAPDFKEWDGKKRIVFFFNLKIGTMFHLRR